MRSPQFPKHFRQFMSYDAMMFSSGHQKNVSSASTSQDSPCKSAGTAGEVREGGTIWQTCLAAMAEQRTTEMKRMYLLLLYELTRKGDLSITKQLFSFQMQSEPKRIRVSVTVSEFLSRFSANTRARISSLLTPNGYGSAVWDFTCSDVLQTEDLFHITPIDEAAVISESLSSVDLPEEENAYETPDKSHHERSATTIYHEETETSPPLDTHEVFHPGPLLESVLKTLEYAWTEDPDDMELVMVGDM